MQKTILAVLAASVAIAPIAASAQNHGRDHGRPAPQQSWKKWRKGERFDRSHARNYQEVDYRKYRGLRAPPRGYRWVRSDNDAVLVAITTGVIASVIAGAIH